MSEHVGIEQIFGRGLATVIARKDTSPQQICHALGMKIPTGPRCACARDRVLVGIAPGTWLAQYEHPEPLWIEKLREALDGLASVCDQSSAYILWRLSGRGARTLLQRGTSLDFHPESFAPGCVATSVLAHIDVIVRQLDDMPSYEIATFRSYTKTFRDWLDRTVAAL